MSDPAGTEHVGEARGDPVPMAGLPRPDAPAPLPVMTFREDDHDTVPAQGWSAYRAGSSAAGPVRAGLPTPGRGSARAAAPSPFLPMARVAALIGALTAVGIVHVWSHTRVTAAGYRLGELQRTQESLRAQRDRLEIEVATLRAPGRLEEFARTRLKMAPPAPGAVVAARAGDTAGRAGTAIRRDGVRAAEPMVFTATAR